MAARVVEGTGLENRRAETYRGFESLAIRWWFLEVFAVCLHIPFLAVSNTTATPLQWQNDGH